jgi:hypothetical protein
LNGANEEESQQKRAAGAALVAGLLLHFATLFLWEDSPNDTLGVLTGIFPAIPYDRCLKYPLVVLFFFLFCWRTVTLYRKHVISLATQFWYVVLALLVGWIWFFIALSRLQFDVVR